ncbi:hypothetical protein Tco_0945045, partial [Tanacetum coccineum]
ITSILQKKLIQVLKIHTDDNVADLLTKAFDVSSSLGFRASLGRALDGTKALMLPKLFILWLETVSTDSAELVPMGKVSTAIETLKNNTAKALISLSPTITHSNIIAVLESYPKHNMVAYLEKTYGNAEFHKIIDFLTRSSIHHALTISPVGHNITAKIAGKPVPISKASMRSDLLFDDANGIDSLPNQAIFDDIQFMGHLDAKKKFVMYPRFISIFLDKQLENVPVPLDHFPVNALTSKVFSFMVKKGKHFSGKVTPLFASMLVQPTEDEGAPSERPSEAQPTPSPPHPSEATVDPQSDPSPRPSPSTTIPDSIPESSGGNHGDQAKEIQHLKAQIKKLKKQAKPVITHHRAWMKSVSLKQRLAGKRSLKKNWMQKEYVSKQGRKSAKAEPSVHKDPLFDEIPKDTVDYMETEDAQDVGRTRDVVEEKKENAKDVLSTEDVLSTAQQKVSTNKEKVSTDRPIVSTDGSKVSTDKEKDSTDRKDEGTDDQTEGTDDQTEGKKKIEEEDESESESDGIPEAEKKFKQLASDEEMARKVQEEWEGEEERKRLAEEEATNDALIRNYDRNKEERSEFLHESTLSAQRNFLAHKDPKLSGTNILQQNQPVKSNDDIIEALLNKVSSPDEDYLVIYKANGNFRALNYLMEKEMNKVILEWSNKIEDLSHGGCLNPVESAYWAVNLAKHTTKPILVGLLLCAEKTKVAAEDG